MYKWYENAEFCFVYLSDVDLSWGEREAVIQGLRNSRWFTRGWTLQELIAPLRLLFYDRHWKYIGSRPSLKGELRAATGIPPGGLDHPLAYSVGQRMSWASARQTTRPEDLAYCLMGLFDVNMPLLYGERGAKAFLRLQLEIIKVSDDESIFAWARLTGYADRKTGLLTDDPFDYRQCGNVLHMPGSRRPPYQVTNKGLQINLAAKEAESMYKHSADFLHEQHVKLKCVRQVRTPGGTVNLPLAILLFSREDGIWQRLSATIHEDCTSQSINLVESNDDPDGGSDQDSDPDYLYQEDLDSCGPPILIPQWNP